MKTLPLIAPPQSPKQGALQKVREIKKRYWKGAGPGWGDADLSGKSLEKGFFNAPRTLPLVLAVLAQKDVSGNQDPGAVYIELLSRHKYEGIVEIGNEGDHAFNAGYTGNRATRTWRERMRILEKTGFIKVMKRANQEFGWVFLVHPAVVLQHLRAQGRMSTEFWDAYELRQIEGKERTYEELAEKHRLDDPTVPRKRKIVVD